MFTSHEETASTEAAGPQGLSARAGLAGPGCAAGCGVRVHAPGRLHLGFLDPAGSLGRRYGSLGLVIDGFETSVALEPAPADEIEVGPAPQERARLQQHLEALRRHGGSRQPLRVRLLQALPAHCGFGSGTQLALAMGRAFAALHGLPWTTPDVARLLGRGLRSGVGIAGFDQGGFIVDGGPADGGDAAAPVLARLTVPVAWRIVIVQDERQHGLHGAEELQALERLPPFPREHAADLCHHVLMQLLPALAEGRFEPFAQSLSHLQRRIGDHFAPAQGGSMYTSPAVARLMQWIAQSGPPAGLGQSSWGPTAFAFQPSAQAALRLVEQAHAAGAVDPSLRLRIVAARNSGAVIETFAAGERPAPG
jgi:beta-ribofuranosylaminobenzene 5'-phosphate synthase